MSSQTSISVYYYTGMRYVLEVKAAVGNAGRHHATHWRPVAYRIFFDGADHPLVGDLGTVAASRLGELLHESYSK